MNTAPKSLRLQIGIFGRMNAGKSTFLNFVAGQDVAITSSVAGTTTDVVEKTMEFLPLGPVVLLDTAGLDDDSGLGGKRVERTHKALDRSDIAILVVEPGVWGEAEDAAVRTFTAKNKPFVIVVNKADLREVPGEFLERLKGVGREVLVLSSTDMSRREERMREIKHALLALCPADLLRTPSLLGDLVPSGGTVVLIVPIDLQAPKGRLILPQVQAIRDALDNDASVMVVKEREYVPALSNLKRPPDLVVCDSQVVM
ncbi:MAG: GTP-binding protein, partial [Elusimicrobia bacterium]|nr:GTP-binding protein [Elusimicrobiota bacterium]